MLGYFNNCNIIKFPHKEIPNEYIEKIHQVVLYRIIENMAALVKTGQYGATNTTYITITSYYVIKLFSDAYTLQEETTCDEEKI